MKCLVVNIMPHGPAYHFEPDVRPDIAWEKPDGTWVGFWPREWPDLLGEAVLKCSDAYEWEVWQPDLRADEVYSRTLETGVTHRLFPAKKQDYRLGIRSQAGIYSEAMLARLAEASALPMILHLHGFRIPFYGEMIVRCGGKKRCPIFIIGHGMSIVPMSEMRGLHRPLTYACLLLEQQKLVRQLRNVDVISAQSEFARRETQKVFRGRTELLTMGCDFDFWVPVPSIERKQAARQTLGVRSSSMVFLATGNFVSLKQFDRLLEVFSRLPKPHDFVLLIAGHGDRASTERLEALSRSMAAEGKAILHPYVAGAALRDLYWASDVYLSVSTGEGASVSVMKAMACGLAVLSTPVGETSERMRRYGVGKLVPVDRYDEWKIAIEGILDKGLPPALDRAVAQEAYDWPQVARRFISVYEDLCKEYFGSQVGSHV